MTRVDDRRADDVADALERLFLAYWNEYHDGETVRMWSARVGDAAVAFALDDGPVGASSSKEIDDQSLSVAPP